MPPIDPAVLRRRTAALPGKFPDPAAVAAMRVAGTEEGLGCPTTSTRESGTH